MKKYLHRIMFLILITTILLTGKNVKAATIKHSGTSGSLEWSIDSDGVFRLSGSGDYAVENEDGETETAWERYSSKIYRAVINVTNITSFDRLFKDCENLQSIDWSNTNTSKLTSMEDMFEDCNEMVEIDLSDLDTSNVKSMNGTFSSCRELQKVTGLNTKSVEDMSYMFYYCQCLADVNLSRWDTSKVINMRGMFSNCYELTVKDIDRWDTSSVTDMSYMFSQCYALTDIDISQWDTSNVINMRGMFDNDGNGYTSNHLKSIKLNGIDTSNVTNMQLMFEGCSKLTTLEIDELDTSSVTNMAGMFEGCAALTNLNLNKWNTSRVKEMYNMFFQCYDLEKLDISQWNTSKVTDMRDMFGWCSSLTEIDMSNFRTKQLECIAGMFYFCTSLKKIDLSKFNLSNIKEESGIFYNNIDLTEIKCPPNLNINIPLLDELFVPGTGQKIPKQIKWVDKDGKEYKQLPKNLSKSILLKRVMEDTGDTEDSNTSKNTTVIGDTTGAPSANLKIGNNVEFMVPDDVPIIGGGKVALDFANIPIQYEQDGNTFKLGIGIKDLNKFDENGWFTFKKFVETQDENYAKGISDLLSARKGAVSMGWEGEPKISCYGYAQGVITKSGIQSCGGQIMIQLHYKKEKQIQTTIVVVPVVIKFSGEVGVDQTLSIGLDFEHGSVYTQGSTELILPAIRVSGGVGIAYVADVSVYGGGENKITLTSSDAGTTSVKAELSGEAGVSAKALFASWEKPIISGTWEYYNSDKKVKTVNSKIAMQSLSADLDEYSVYRDDSNWNAGVQKRSLVKDSVKTLVTDVFKDTKPILVQTESGKKVLVFVSDISERTTGNHTAVVYSVYNEETRTWSEPTVVDDDGTADFKPSVAVHGENVIVAWSNTKKQFAENEVNADDFLEQVAKNLDIEVATIHLNDSTIQCKVITNDQYMDTNASIAVAKNGAYVTWVQNQKNDVLNMSGKNCIYVAQESTGWKPSVMKQTNQVVKTVVAGIIQENPVVSYVVDKDGMSETTNDTQLFISDLKGKQILAVDNIVCENPQFSCVNGINSMTWYTEKDTESNIAYLDSLNGKIKYVLDDEQIITSDYSIADGQDESLILFSNGKQNEDGKNIYAYQLRNGMTDGAVEVTDGTSYSSSPVAISTGDGYTMMFLQNKVDITSDSVTEEVDLSTMDLSYKEDIEIENISYEKDKMLPGRSAEVAVVVRNNGLADSSEGTIQIMNGQEVIASLQVEDGIAAGVTKEYVLSITLPTSIEQIDSYIVKVALGNDVQMDSFQPAFNDLQLEVEEVDGKYEMTITNNGNVETNANLVIYDQETDGTELAHYSLGQLACGEEVEKSFAKDELLQLGETLCVNVENPQEELLESNNKTYLYVGDDIVQSLDHLAATKTKVVYKTGEKLNLDDVILYAVYEDGEEVEVTGYTTNVQDIDMSKAGKKKLTLVYEENYVVRTVSFDITVEENVPKENGENKPDSSNTPVAVGNTNVPISVNTGNTETAADVSSMIFPKVKGVKVKTKKRARILIQWKKIKNVSQYQIQIAPNKKFKKSVKTKNVRKCKYIWKKLKKGKTYYVHIRACANGKYGPWSKVKKVKVK